MAPLASHPLPDQARSQSPPTSTSYENNSNDETVAAAGESGAADKGKHKKNLWHRTADPFAGLLTETIPGKLSLRSGRKKSPDAVTRSK